MALEQWEIELQNQLHDSIKQNEVPEVQQKQSEPVIDNAEPQITSEPTVESSSSIPFLVLLVILSIVMLYLYDAKSGGKIKDWVASHFSSKSAPIEKVEEKKVEIDINKYKEMYEKLSSEQKNQLEALQNKVGTLRDKVMLMGLLLNENFNIIKQNENKEEMVFFNRDWTLDKMPTHIDLSDEDKEYLKKYIK